MMLHEEIANEMQKYKKRAQRPLVRFTYHFKSLRLQQLSLPESWILAGFQCHI